LGDIQVCLGGAQHYKIKGGSQQIAEKLAEIVSKENIALSSSVTAIERSDTGISVTINGTRVVTCKYCICTVPFSKLSMIRFVPELPPHKVNVANSMKSGRILKYVLIYSRCFWREKGLSGKTLLMVLNKR
jgi:monoamine oxidase